MTAGYETGCSVVGAELAQGDYRYDSAPRSGLVECDIVGVELLLAVPWLWAAEVDLGGLCSGKDFVYEPHQGGMSNDPGHLGDSRCQVGEVLGSGTGFVPDIPLFCGKLKAVCCEGRRRLGRQQFWDSDEAPLYQRRKARCADGVVARGPVTAPPHATNGRPRTPRMAQDDLASSSLTNWGVKRCGRSLPIRSSLLSGNRSVYENADLVLISLMRRGA